MLPLVFHLSGRAPAAYAAMKLAFFKIVWCNLRNNRCVLLIVLQQHRQSCGMRNMKHKVELQIRHLHNEDALSAAAQMIMTDCSGCETDERRALCSLDVQPECVCAVVSPTGGKTEPLFLYEAHNYLQIYPPEPMCYSSLSHLLSHAIYRRACITLLDIM